MWGYDINTILLSNVKCTEAIIKVFGTSNYDIKWTHTGIGICIIVYTYMYMYKMPIKTCMCVCT